MNEMRRQYVLHISDCSCSKASYNFFWEPCVSLSGSFAQSAVHFLLMSSLFYLKYYISIEIASSSSNL
jgi:hypothetical protein